MHTLLISNHLSATLSLCCVRNLRTGCIRTGFCWRTTGHPYHLVICSRLHHSVTCCSLHVAKQKGKKLFEINFSAARVPTFLATRILICSAGEGPWESLIREPVVDIVWRIAVSTRPLVTCLRGMWAALLT